jgi:hypothetical protein
MNARTREAGAAKSDAIGLPDTCVMPALTRDFGALDRHALLASYFLPSPSPDARYQQFRLVLVFRMMKAARNYSIARASVLAQIAEQLRWKMDTSGGQGLPILEFAAAFDDCMSDLYVVGRTIQRMGRLQLADVALLEFSHTQGTVIKTLKIMRSKSDHMDEEIEKQCLQGGPSRPFISKDGARALLGPYEVSLADVAHLIEDLYDSLAATFKGFLSLKHGA